MLLFYHAKRNNSHSLFAMAAVHPPDRIRRSAGFNGGDGAVRASVLTRHRSCLHVSALELKKRGKAGNVNEFSPPCW